jgi:hypothetical protein
VYGSDCSSDLAAFGTITTPPDFISAATGDGNMHTSQIPCVPSSYWTQQQRHKQYLLNHSETWNGLNETVDDDCSNGPVWPSGNAGSGCV